MMKATYFHTTLFQMASNRGFKLGLQNLVIIMHPTTWYGLGTDLNCGLPAPALAPFPRLEGWSLCLR